MPSPDRKLVSVPGTVHKRLQGYADLKSTSLGKAISILLDAYEGYAEKAKRWSAWFPEDEGWKELRYSEQATIHAGDGALINLWQHNLAAIMAERDVNGKQIRKTLIIRLDTGAVAEEFEKEAA